MESEIDSLRILCVSRGNEVDRLRKVIKDHKDQEPVAYQRRDTLQPHCEGWSNWQETDKMEYERITSLLKEFPHYADRVEVRSLVVAL